MTDRKPNRSDGEINGEILTLSLNGERITWIMYGARLSYTMVREHLDRLIDKGLLEIVRDGQALSYRTTPKGKEYLHHIESMRELVAR